MKKVALVTGAYQGIGKGIAEMLEEKDFIVVYSDVHIHMQNVTYYCKCDISKASDRQALLEYIENQFGRLDVLVNNAGVACKKRLDILETTEESFDRLIDINTKGTFFISQLFANYMISKLGKLKDYTPRIVNIASNSSYTSSVSRGEYCISKAGVSMITKLFADRLGEYGIPVLEVRPGIIKTPMTEVVTEKYDKLIFEQNIVPFQRWGSVEDVAKCVYAAVSGLLDFSTGTVLNADGGFHIQRL